MSVEKTTAKPFFSDWGDKSAVVNVLQIKPSPELTIENAKEMCDVCRFDVTKLGNPRDVLTCHRFQHGDSVHNLKTATIASQIPLRRRDWERLLVNYSGCKPQT